MRPARTAPEIPRSVRERLDPSPGQQVQALVYDGRVELIPMRPAKALRGFLTGAGCGLLLSWTRR